MVSGFVLLPEILMYLRPIPLITTSDYEYEANLFAVALLVDEQRLNMPLRQMSNAALKSVIDYNL